MAPEQTVPAPDFIQEDRSMKKRLCVILSLALVFSLMLAGIQAETYTGTGNSKIGGEASLEVEVALGEGGVIESVVVKSNKETPGISDSAIADIPAAIVEYQSLLVDTIAGVTYTSDAILMAVRDALAKAGVDIAKYEVKIDKTVEKAPDEVKTADVVVIGAGGAGMTAAVQAHMNGATVLILEKMPKVGGNTILSGGALNAVDDRSETAIKQNDSVEWHYQQTLAGGDYQGIPSLVHILTSRAWEAVEWVKALGMGFVEDGIFTVTGGMWPRAHKPSDPVGTGFFKTYMAYIESHEGIELMLNTEATELIVDEFGAVTGVIATGETGNTITAQANKGVVMATGGFARNVQMRQTYNTQWADLGESIPSTNHPGATGDGIKMLMKVGADLIQMGNIQLLPIGDPQTGSLSGNIEFGVDSRVFVNKEGNRFVNEGGRRDEMTRALFEQTDNYMWMIMDSDKYPTGEELNNFNESINSLVAEGRAFRGETLEELAGIIGVDYENLKAALDDYNKHCETLEKDAFGRTIYGTPIDTPPFYAAGRVPTVHHTMGGVHINEYAQVLNEMGGVIKGLYAAGEITGGIHGANRLGGNALTDLLVFGRIAGESAAMGR
jgi:urocanate reductase